MYCTAAVLSFDLTRLYILRQLFESTQSSPSHGLYLSGNEVFITARTEGGPQIAVVKVLDQVNVSSEKPDDASTVSKSALADALRVAAVDGTAPFMRAKLSVVGEGRAGKTTTIRALLGRGFDAHEQSTVGAATSECEIDRTETCDFVKVDKTNAKAEFEEARRRTAINALSGHTAKQRATSALPPTAVRVGPTSATESSAQQAGPVPSAQAGLAPVAVEQGSAATAVKARGLSRMFTRKLQPQGQPETAATRAAAPEPRPEQAAAEREAAGREAAEKAALEEKARRREIEAAQRQFAQSEAAEAEDVVKQIDLANFGEEVRKAKDGAEQKAQLRLAIWDYVTRRDSNPNSKRTATDPRSTSSTLLPPPHSFG